MFRDGIVAEAAGYHRPAMSTPTEIRLHQKSRLLEIAFDDGRAFRLSYECLRVFSPSAEVRGHGPRQDVLLIGKRDIDIRQVEPVGSYAIQPTLSDGHYSTGIYSSDCLYPLGLEHDARWAADLEQLKAAGAGR
jgi:DUF971 family protein